MLLWLAAPLSTASLERAFSYFTQVRHDLSRHCMTPAHVLECVWAHVHAAEITRRRLEDVLAGSTIKRKRVGDVEGGAHGGAGGGGGAMDED